MKTQKTGLLKTSAIAIALLGSAALVATVAVPDFAYAKEGKGNGGNGKGGGKGNGGGKGSDGGKGGGNGKGNGGGNGKGNSKGGGSAAAKDDGQKSAGKSGSRSSKSGKARSGASKTKGFSLKGLLGGKKTRTEKAKTRQKTHSVTRKSTKSVHVTESVRPTARTKGNKIAALLGAHPSELGALNAANASETALQNASPNSRVGRIATYRDTVLAGDALREDFEEAKERLDGLNPPERPVSEIDADLETALSDVQTNQDRVTELEEALEDVGGTDPDIEAELDAARSDLQDSVEEAEALADERRDAVEYDETVTEVADLEEQVDEQALTEREALENAANKPVTDEVEVTVKALLGLY